VPFLEGERTPNRPDSTGALHGIRLATSTSAHLARATVEGLLCGLADGLDALTAQGASIRRVLLIGGGARSAAVRQIAPAILGRPVAVPPPAEYVAEGAARQAAWVLSGAQQPPEWKREGVERCQADPTPEVRRRYAEARDLTVRRP
jgi:xylulokinase